MLPCQIPVLFGVIREIRGPWPSTVIREIRGPGLRQ
jgi:hypothetical protein